MLQQMLMLIRSGKAGTHSQLADLLNVSEALVSQMIDQLVATGYLAQVVMCSEGCQACSQKAACGSGDRELRLWSLTDKGQRAIAEQG
jgi:predicted ArsR family transcriptional regulator